MCFSSNKTLIDVACQRLDSNPYTECLLYGRRAAYREAEERRQGREEAEEKKGEKNKTEQ
jgi:hypothetical protein